MREFHTPFVLRTPLLNLSLARSSHELAPHRLNSNRLSFSKFPAVPVSLNAHLSSWNTDDPVLCYCYIKSHCVLSYTLCTHLLENCFITFLLYGLGIILSRIPMYNLPLSPSLPFSFHYMQILIP